MENRKISLQELTDTIATQSGVTKRFTESFLRELVEVIQEYLEKDGVVKVKGLGTFKLQWNEPRKSVDVSTGNAIVLPGYYKVTFVADADVKEQINAPYAHLETVMGAAEVISEVDESMNRGMDESLTVQREQSDIASDSPNHQITESPERSDIASDSPNNQITDSPERSDIGTDSPNNQITASPERSDIASASPSKKKWWIIVVVLLLLCLLGAAGFYWRNILIPQQNTLKPSQIKVPEVVVKVDTIEAVIEDTLPVVAVDSVAKEITLENYTYQDALNAPVREMVTVIDGSRLTMVAYRAYGHKAFWVYVYDANRNVLSSPNAVEKGMQLVIPDLPLSIVNPKSKLCIDKALELAKQY